MRAVIIGAGKIARLVPCPEALGVQYFADGRLQMLELRVPLHAPVSRIDFGPVLIAATGLDLVSSLTASAALLGNVGPGLGVVGPAGNYSSLADAAKWTGSALMLLGRLELYTVLVLFSPAFWRR